MKKPSLSAAMASHDTKSSSQQVVDMPQKMPLIAVQPGRVGKKQVLGYFSAECKKQMKQMGVDHDKTEQDLLAEALNDLFIKYGKATLA